ncbi:glycosyltransferase family 4 protein [Thermohalobacter berrensis]|uniref:Glycosyl transferase family 1 domain-containing protein n=1 Tax=Thermohalobacter berrensis TaxID=99594 RepID=A0A419T4C3_9FIRM|nr:glycosyltransferase family 4 protein [Thermohalobacter berrensis]RKD32273.1 hypothetical protein BET03_02880 [Thermohalobacter berrensis]
MKVAYFSPLSPKKTGISDYSEELLPYLSRHMKLDLYVDNFKPSNKDIIENFRIYTIDDFHKNNKYKEYDHIIYHIGNNAQYHEQIYKTALKYPGIIVIHDYAIHHLIAQLTVGKKKYQEYVEEMKYNYGKEGEKFARESLEGKRRVMWETGNTLNYPANKRLLDTSKAAIVHSKYIKKLVRKTRNNIPVKYVPLPTPDIKLVTEEEKNILRNKYNIPKDKLVIASFGFISRAKRIDKVIAALKEIKKDFNNFIYILVGEEEKGVYEMSKYSREIGMSDYVKCTGFVTLDEFKEYIKLSDICINLRYPTQGETSASLVRIFGMGKPVIVTDIGTFSEYPDEFALKVSYGEKEEEDIYNTLKYLINNKYQLKEIGKKAYEYAKKNHTTEHAASKYYELLRDIDLGRVYKGDVDAYIKLYNEIGDKLYEIGISEEREKTLINIAKIVNESI